jgi:hypothetical protein
MESKKAREKNGNCSVSVRTLDYLNLPLVLMVDGKVREVGRIDIASDWKFKGWISEEVASALKLETSLGSVALNPHSDQVVLDERGLLNALNEYYDDQTLIKVVEVLRKTVPDVTYEVVTEIINELQNAGILFRERKN